MKAVANNYVRDFKTRQTQVFNGETTGDAAPESFDSGLDAGPGNNKNSVVTESHINFIDLAGSEKVSSHFDRNSGKTTEDKDFTEGGFENFEEKSLVGNTSQRVKEGKAINKS